MLCLAAAATLHGGVVFETTSPYHHIRVVDSGGVRTLSFDGSRETRMSLANPLQGHFEYTEFFHLPWLWHTNLQRVLMIGLGGGSTQRSYQHYYPCVVVETAEIDPVVVYVAKRYFHVTEGPTHVIHTMDGRLQLRRTGAVYDAIVIDAYTTTRYGSFIPYHLTTKEFFELAKGRLATNGVIAYNVIGSVRGYRANIVGAMYKTLNAVFPQVYVFQARESHNIVLIATREERRVPRAGLLQRARLLGAQGRIRLPTFLARVQSLVEGQPGMVTRSPVLTDDHAPVDGLLGGSRSP